MLKKNKEIQSGFTLLELLVVLIIIGILAAYALGSLESSYRYSAMTKAAETLKSDIEFTRSEAFSRARSVAICPTTDISAAEPSCSTDWEDLNDVSAISPGWIVYVNTDSDLMRQTGELILKKSSFDGISGRIKVGTTAFSAIRFTPRATTSNSTIPINNVKSNGIASTCNIVTFVLGRVRKEGNGC